MSSLLEAVYNLQHLFPVVQPEYCIVSIIVQLSVINFFSFLKSCCSLNLSCSFYGFFLVLSCYNLLQLLVYAVIDESVKTLFTVCPLCSVCGVFLSMLVGRSRL